MKYLILTALILSSALHAEPIDPALADDEDIVNLYRTNARQDEKISELREETGQAIKRLADDMHELREEVRSRSSVRQEQVREINNQVRQNTYQPTPSPVPHYYQGPASPIPLKDNTWYDGKGRKRYPADKAPGH
jgi:hypothetical protein